MLVTVAKPGMTGNERAERGNWDHDFSIQHV